MPSVFRSSNTILIHGMEADWIEEEISDGDGEFLKDVLEQKVFTAFTSAGIQKKVDKVFGGSPTDIFHLLYLPHPQVSLPYLTRWKEGPTHRNNRPVVVQFKHG